MTPHGQLTTSTSTSARAASIHGSSNVRSWAGTAPTAARRGASGPGGGHVGDQSIARASKFYQNGKGGPFGSSSIVGPPLLHGRQRLGVRHVRRLEDGVLETASTSPIAHTVASRIGRPSWVMATRNDSALRPLRNVVTWTSTASKVATPR